MLSSMPAPLTTRSSGITHDGSDPLQQCQKVDVPCRRRRRRRGSSCQKCALRRGCVVLSTLPAPLTTRSSGITHDGWDPLQQCQKGGRALQAQEKAAQQQLPNVRFETGDMDALALPAGAFDAALCSNGMIYCQDVGGALRCISRCLRPGGRLVFNTPMAHPWPGPGLQSFNLACEASKHPTSGYDPSCL